MKKNLLFICYYYWPDQSIGAVRPTKVIKYLRNKYSITVLTHSRENNNNKNTYDGQYANRIIEIDSEVSRVSAQIDSLRETNIYKRLRNQEWKKYEKKIGEEKERQIQENKSNNSMAEPSLGRKMSQDMVLLQHEYFDDKKYICNAKEYIKQHSEEFCGFDVIISTYALMSSHIIAKFVKKYSHRAVWIADFRDPPIIPATPLIMRVYYSRCLKRIDLESNWITSVSQGSLDRIIVRHKKKKVVITNGFDPEDRINTKEAKVFISNSELVKHNDSLNFLYTGNLYMENGSFIPIFKAVSDLISKGIIDKEKVHFYKIGNDYSIFARQAEACGLEKYITNLGVVNRNESIALQMSADLLMLVSWNTDKEKGIISGKFYEYLSAEKPIICCMKGNVPNSELKQWINGHKLGVCYEEADDLVDFPKLCSFIEKMYNEKINQGIIKFSTDKEFISQFTHDKIAERFVHLIEISEKNNRNL